MKGTIKIFGILNITPDSFSDGGKFFTFEKALKQAKKLFAEGADYVDVGGQSTRPGAQEITPDEEWNRTQFVIKNLIQQYPGKISLDTQYAENAKKFLQLGGSVLNDVSGFQDEKMRELAAIYKPLVIVNHFPGKTIQEVHEQKISSIERVKNDLLSRKKELIKAGILPENIILDPGIGFGKTMKLNTKLLEFAIFVPGEKVLIGHSKKRFLGEGRFTIERNLQAAQVAIRAGAKYLRVHEVRPYRKH